jgi:hypothetical protein
MRKSSFGSGRWGRTTLLCIGIALDGGGSSAFAEVSSGSLEYGKAIKINDIREIRTHAGKSH